jgi:hypothetical protein
VYNFNDQVEINMRTSCVVDIDLPSIRADLPLTAWELVPYSFVVDWFYDVGSFLEAHTLAVKASGLAIGDGYDVTLVRNLDNVTHTLAAGWSGSINQTATSYGKLTRRVPGSVSQSPSWNVRLDEFKVLDLISLGAQFLKRR